MILLLTMSRDGLIGSGPELPWNLPEARRQNAALAEGETVLLGRRGWELLGDDFKRSQVVVLSPSLAASPPPGVQVGATVEEALTLAWNHGRKIYCAGGARLLEEMVPLAEKAYISHPLAPAEGDVHLPAFVAEEWREERRSEKERFELVIYRRA